MHNNFVIESDSNQLISSHSHSGDDVSSQTVVVPPIAAKMTAAVASVLPALTVTLTHSTHPAAKDNNSESVKAVKTPIEKVSTVTSSSKKPAAIAATSESVPVPAAVKSTETNKSTRR